MFIGNLHAHTHTHTHVTCQKQFSRTFFPVLVGNKFQGLNSDLLTGGVRGANFVPSHSIAYLREICLFVCNFPN